MKIERFEDLIDWTRDTHAMLARCMARCSDKHDETRAKWLLVYIADHERALAETVDKIEKHADPKALHTWIYDYLTQSGTAQPGLQGLRHHERGGYRWISSPSTGHRPPTVPGASGRDARNLAETCCISRSTRRCAWRAAGQPHSRDVAQTRFEHTAAPLRDCFTGRWMFELSGYLGLFPGSLRRCDPAAHAVRSRAGRAAADRTLCSMGAGGAGESGQRAGLAGELAAGPLCRALSSQALVPVNERQLARAQASYHRYGRWTLLLSWVPIIGDPLTLVAGVMREPLWSFLLIVSLAKTGRYLMVMALTLGWM